MFYCVLVTGFSIFMIYKVAPKYGRKNPLIYLSICSTVGSLSVMAVKAFGIALKLTFAGKNQFSHPSTYAFAIVVVVCVLTQMNYFNKALSQFSTNMYVPWTSKPCNFPGNNSYVLLTATTYAVVSTLCTTSPSRPSRSLPRLSFSVASTQPRPSTPSPSSVASS